MSRGVSTVAAGVGVSGSNTTGANGKGVYGEGSVGVYGEGPIGVEGKNSGGSGYGVKGENRGSGAGVHGAGNGLGVEGITFQSGTGVRGISTAEQDGTGVYGEGSTVGVEGMSDYGSGGDFTGRDFGVVGVSPAGGGGTGTSGIGDLYGVFGDGRQNGMGVYGKGAVGVKGEGSSGQDGGVGVEGTSRGYEGVGVYGHAATGVKGESSLTGSNAVEGHHSGTSGRGVYGSGTTGVQGYTTRDDGTGVKGVAGTLINLPFSGMAVGGHFTAQGSASTKVGVVGEARGTGRVAGVYGKAPVRNGSFAGFFDGNVNATGEITTRTLQQLSDRRLKEEIRDLAGVEALALVEGLRPRRYRFRAGFGSDTEAQRIERLGFVAQEVEVVLPELVREQVLAGGAFQLASSDADEGLYKSVDYVSLVPVLTAALQAQQKQIEEQQAQIDLLIEVLRAQGLDLSDTAAGR